MINVLEIRNPIKSHLSCISMIDYWPITQRKVCCIKYEMNETIILDSVF